MTVEELLKKINKTLEPFKDCNVNDDFSAMRNGITLDDAFSKCFEGTDLLIDYKWNYDD